MASKPAVSERVAPSLTVLVVDDDLDSLCLIKEGLAEASTRVLIAQSTETALCLLRESQIDVLVCSLVVAKADGHELLGTVRKRWPWIARILVTTSVGGITARHVFPAAQSVVQKPVDAGALRVLLKHLPGRRQP